MGLVMTSARNTRCKVCLDVVHQSTCTAGKQPGNAWPGMYMAPAKRSGNTPMRLCCTESLRLCGCELRSQLRGRRLAVNQCYRASAALNQTLPMQFLDTSRLSKKRWRDMLSSRIRKAPLALAYEVKSRD